MPKRNPQSAPDYDPAELRRNPGVLNIVLRCPEFQHKPHSRNDPAWSGEGCEPVRVSDEDFERESE